MTWRARLSSCCPNQALAVSHQSSPLPPENPHHNRQQKRHQQRARGWWTRQQDSWGKDDSPTGNTGVASAVSRKTTPEEGERRGPDGGEKQRTHRPRGKGRSGGEGTDGASTDRAAPPGAGGVVSLKEADHHQGVDEGERGEWDQRNGRLSRGEGTDGATTDDGAAPLL